MCECDKNILPFMPDEFVIVKSDRYRNRKWVGRVIRKAPTFGYFLVKPVILEDAIELGMNAAGLATVAFDEMVIVQTPF